MTSLVRTMQPSKPYVNKQNQLFYGVIMEPSQLQAKEVERSFEENVKIRLTKLALDYTEKGTLEELAWMIGVHPITVYTWSKVGSVPPRKARFIESTFGASVITAASLNKYLSA